MNLAMEEMELQNITQDKALSAQICMAALEAEAYEGVDSTELIKEVERSVRRFSARNGGTMPSNEQLNIIFDSTLSRCAERKEMGAYNTMADGMYVVYLDTGSYMLTPNKEYASMSVERFMREL